MKRRRSSFAVQEGRACDSKRLAICGSVRMTCRASLVTNATIETRNWFDRNFKMFRAALCSRGVHVAHFFVGCFSLNGDELGQWRAYAVTAEKRPCANRVCQLLRSLFWGLFADDLSVRGRRTRRGNPTRLTLHPTARESRRQIRPIDDVRAALSTSRCRETK
jgi:hypothetical protein